MFQSEPYIPGRLTKLSYAIGIPSKFRGSVEGINKILNIGNSVINSTFNHCMKCQRRGLEKLALLIPRKPAATPIHPDKEKSSIIRQKE